MHQGIFTESFGGAPLPIIYDPATTRVDPATGLLTRDPFPGNRIPANRIDPIGQALLNLLPNPTFTDRLGGNYLANPVKTLNDYQGDLRIDHNFSNNDRVFGRLSLEKADQYLPTGLPDFGAPGGFASNQTFDTDALNVALSHTRVFGSGAVNQFTAGYNRVYNYITSFGYGSNKARELGIPGANLGTDETSSLTRMTFQNFVGIGDRGFSPFQGGTDVYHYSDTLTMVRGNHTFNTGGTFRAMQLNLLGDTALAGQFAFTPFFTSGFNAAGALNGATGYSIASLLLGLPASGGRNDQLNGSVKGRRWKEFRGFIDDTWRMSDALTLTLGLAYMVTTPQSEAHDRFANFDFYTGETFVGGTVGVKTDWSNIQPRLGFAWTPGGAANTVLRGGYGIYHDVSAMGGSTGPYQNPPYANAYAFTSDNITPVRTLATGFPVNSQPVDPANYRGDWTTIDPNSKQGRIQQWSINVEQQLPFSTIGSVAYAGTYGDRLFDKTRNLNTATPGPGFNPAARRPYPAAAGGQRRPQPRLDEVQLAADAARAAHHPRPLPARGLHLRQGDHQRRVGLRRRPRHRLLPGRHRRRRRRRVGQHRPAPQLHAEHALSAAVVQTTTGGVTEAVLGDWSVNLIFVAHSGYPLGMSMANNQSGTAFGNRPDRVCDGTLDDPTVQRWFDTSCFVAPAVGVLGNAERTTLFGPGRWNADMALSKKFRRLPVPRRDLQRVQQRAVRRAEHGGRLAHVRPDHLDRERLAAGAAGPEVHLLTTHASGPGPRRGDAGPRRTRPRAHRARRLRHALGLADLAILKAERR